MFSRAASACVYQRVCGQLLQATRSCRAWNSGARKGTHFIVLYQETRGKLSVSKLISGTSYHHWHNQSPLLRASVGAFVNIGDIKRVV